MTTPTIAQTGLAATAGGGLISAAGAFGSGTSTAAMYNYQVAVAQLNSKIAADNANYAISSGQTQATISGMNTRAQIGQTIAREGASNIAVGSGSPADVVASEHKIGQINTANILNNAARIAYGYRVQGQQEEAEVPLLQTAAQYSQTAGAISGLGSLVSAAGSVSSKWLQAGQEGIPIFGS